MVETLKDKRGITIFNAFQTILHNSERIPNRAWVDQGKEFYNNSFKKWLEASDIEMYSSYNEGKFAVPERFIRRLKHGFTSICQFCQKKFILN